LTGWSSYIFTQQAFAKAAPKGKDSKGAKAKAAPKGKAEAKGGKVETPQEVLKTALQMKTIYVKVMAQAQTLADRIVSGDSKLEFANNPQGVGGLNEKIAKCGARVTPFGHEFMLHDVKTLKVCLLVSTGW
jgi:hypothetical protein